MRMWIKGKFHPLTLQIRAVSKREGLKIKEGWVSN
jgi:hypothetical protein